MLKYIQELFIKYFSPLSEYNIKQQIAALERHFSSGGNHTESFIQTYKQNPYLKSYQTDDTPSDSELCEIISKFYLCHGLSNFLPKMQTLEQAIYLSGPPHKLFNLEREQTQAFFRDTIEIYKTTTPSLMPKDENFNLSSYPIPIAGFEIFYLLHRHNIRLYHTVPNFVLLTNKEIKNDLDICTILEGRNRLWVSELQSIIAHHQKYNNLLLFSGAAHTPGLILKLAASGVEFETTLLKKSWEECLENYFKIGSITYNYLLKTNDQTPLATIGNHQTIDKPQIEEIN